MTNKHTCRGIWRRFPALLLLAVMALSARAADGFTASQLKFLNIIISSYTPWQSVELNGKLQMERLPLTPSVRIYMEYKQKIFISVRAPFVGEVGRVEIDSTQVVAVNRLKKVYVQEPTGNLLSYMNIEDVQDMLLGRVFICDYGTLNTVNMKLCELFNEQSRMLLVPLIQPLDGRVRYGYTFDFNGLMQDMYATTESGSYSALAHYTYPGGNKTGIELDIQIKDKYYGAQMQLDKPKWNPARSLEPVEINRKWKRVDIKTFFKF